jgi:hypothetical protein
VSYGTQKVFDQQYRDYIEPMSELANRVKDKVRGTKWTQFKICRQGESTYYALCVTLHSKSWVYDLIIKYSCILDNGVKCVSILWTSFTTYSYLLRRIVKVSVMKLHGHTKSVKRLHKLKEGIGRLGIHTFWKDHVSK